MRAGVVEGQDRAAHRAAETKVLVPRTESSTLRSGKTSAARNTGSQEDRSTARAADDAARTLRRGCVFLWRGVCCEAFVRRGDAYGLGGAAAHEQPERTCGWHAFGGRFSLASGKGWARTRARGSPVYEMLEDR